MMIDASKLSDHTEIRADIIIIGGGVAGLAIAKEWVDSSKKVVVLESGDEASDPDTQDLYSGSATVRGPDNPNKPFDEHLIASRMRFLGGSGNVWGGKCVPLDPADFASRDWVKNSGWPMTREDLQPFYDRACDLLEIPHFNLDFSEQQVEGRPPYNINGAKHIDSLPRYYTKYTGRNPEGYYERYRTEPAQAPNVDVYLNANVIDIQLDPETELVSGLDVACLNGRRHKAVAGVYILACGGIENARLLLMSKTTHEEGVGNQNDLVGRFFQGHVVIGSYEDSEPGNASAVTMSDPDASLGLYENRSPDDGWHCVYGPTMAGQENYQTPNFTVTLAQGEPELAGDVMALAKGAGIVDTANSEFKGPKLVYHYMMSEQAPNPDSRITLTDDRDALGCPRIHLDWVYTKADLDAVETSFNAFCRELGAGNHGRAANPIERSGLVEVMSASRHHMGTTRMSMRAADGVVDDQCKVHGVDNLYIAGSSVFPTSGIANPTLTLLALAIRLCDHLKLKLAG